MTLANALQRVGIGFELYEQAPELTEVGAGIGLTDGVMRLFDALGLGDDLRARGTSVQHLVLADKRLSVRRKLPVRGEAICVHRADLIDVLKSRLPSSQIRLSKRVVGVQSLPDRAQLDFEGGDSVSASCVVAADGINSVVRASLFPQIAVRHIGQTIWRGVTCIEVPPLLATSYIEIWDERLRYLTVPYDGRMFWLAVKPAPPGELDDPSTVKRELLELFGDFHPILQDLIRHSDGIIRNDMADLGTEPRRWFHNRVGFLGDAIHATTPNLAQGGCQAIEDAVCLALCLKSFPADLHEAYVSYQRLRQKKTDFVVRTSWRFGKAAHSRNPITHYLWRALLERSPDAVLYRQERFLNDLSYLAEVDTGGVVARR